jgi:hypothetical protein
VGVPQLPECIHLARSSSSLASWGRSKDLNLEDTSDGEHGNATMLQLSLTQPVKINTDIINVGKTKGVEANITSHGAVKLWIEEGRLISKIQSQIIFLFLATIFHHVFFKAVNNI